MATDYDDGAGGVHRRAVIALEISSAAELASAQQRMHVLAVSRVSLHNHSDYCAGGRAGDGCDAAGPPGGNVRRGNFIRDNHRVGIESQHGPWILLFEVSWNASTVQEDCTKRKREQRAAAAISDDGPPPQFTRIVNALRRGKNRLVLRQWRQGACWWNLNMNGDDASSCGDNLRVVRGSSRPDNDALDCTSDTSTGITSNETSSTSHTTLSMARAEVAGYRLSRLATDHHRLDYRCTQMNGEGGGASLQRRAYMPEVLFFSYDDVSACSSLPVPLVDGNGRGKVGDCDAPWALMSYFDNGDDGRARESLASGGDSRAPEARAHRVTRGENCNGGHSISTPCHHFPTTMVKVRHEFGFDEPHPRHGRVPSNECLEYGMMILRDVVMPIQGYFFSLACGTAEAELRKAGSADGDVENLSCIGWGDAINPKPFEYVDMIEVYQHAVQRLVAAQKTSRTEGRMDERVDLLLEMLDKCVDALRCEWDAHGGKPPPLPPVLCHMDLQPQNLAFCHADQHDSSGSVSDATSVAANDQRHITHMIGDCSVASVMDWEEACYADPRFELLLMCRKVLANREQADKLWQSYSEHVQKLSSSLSLRTNTQVHWEVGDIEPWLRLETVHSLCTLLLQAMDLLGGGRSPWESKPDLWGKIDRERLRLVEMGWDFCSLPH